LSFLASNSPKTLISAQRIEIVTSPERYGSLSTASPDCALSAPAEVATIPGTVSGQTGFPAVVPLALSVERRPFPWFSGGTALVSAFNAQGVCCVIFHFVPAPSSAGLWSGRSRNAAASGAVIAVARRSTSLPSAAPD
jgi:hypothetical protein